MGYIEIPKNSVPDRALFNKRATNSASFGGSVSSTTTDPNPYDQLYEAGENVTAGNAVVLFTDGKIYHATPLNSDNKYSGWFAVETITCWNLVAVRKYGEIPSTNAITINLPIYLSVMSSGINISQSPITSKSSTADLWHYLGYAKTTEVIVIDIKLPELFN